MDGWFIWFNGDLMVIFNGWFYGDLMVINPLVMEYEWLLGGDWNHGMDYDFSIQLGISSQLTHIFQRSRLKPPTR